MPATQTPRGSLRSGIVTVLKCADGEKHNGERVNAAVVERIPFDALQQLEEPIYHPLIRIDHDLAMLWARYDFFIDGALHHVGANIFSLLKRDDRWLNLRRSGHLA